MTNWIKCSDRMPDRLSDVLVRYSEYGLDKMCVAYLWASGPNHGGKGFWRVVGSNGYGIENEFEFDDVTHWMPLPEPPSEEE